MFFWRTLNQQNQTNKNNNINDNNNQQKLKQQQRPTATNKPTKTTPLWGGPSGGDTPLGWGFETARDLLWAKDLGLGASGGCHPFRKETRTFGGRF